MNYLSLNHKFHIKASIGDSVYIREINKYDVQFEDNKIIVNNNLDFYFDLGINRSDESFADKEINISILDSAKLMDVWKWNGDKKNVNFLKARDKYGTKYDVILFLLEESVLLGELTDYGKQKVVKVLEIDNSFKSYNDELKDLVKKIDHINKFEPSDVHSLMHKVDALTDCVALLVRNKCLVKSSLQNGTIGYNGNESEKEVVKMSNVDKLTTAVNKTMTTVSEETKEALWRTSAKKVTMLAKAPLASALSASDAESLKNLFNSEFGEALLAYAMGVGLSAANSSSNPKVERLSSELRIYGTSVVTDVVADKLLEPITAIMTNVMSKLPDV